MDQTATRPEAAQVRPGGRGSGFLMAGAVLFVIFGWAMSCVPTVLDGGTRSVVIPWVPSIGLELAFRVDALAVIMLILVAGVGTLVCVYSAGYFDVSASSRRVCVTLFAFAMSMVGLVLADDLILLFVLWEATTVFSYLLIGDGGLVKSNRRAAKQALLVTTAGGLAMLLGIVMLGQSSGTYRISEIVAAAPRGGVVTAALVLILVGAISKSALLPLHFWLPAAMAAPTPISAYLHAAAMVKAGIYVVALLGPAFADLPVWQSILVPLGLLTMVFGGWTALRQNDLKLLLAYGTVSQLGFLMALVGSGSRIAALAGATMMLAHGLFKSTLFLVVGVIDHRTGTRDLRELNDLRRRMPGLFLASVAAAASMAGLPPLLGFVGKEAAYEGYLSQWPALLATILGSALTVAYSWRFVAGAFGSRGSAVSPTSPVHWESGTERNRMLGPITVLASAGIILGLLAAPLGELLQVFSDAFPETGEQAYHLALWHGWNAALGLSLLTVSAGAVIACFTGNVRPGGPPREGPAERGYRQTLELTDRVAVRVTGWTQRGSLPIYLGVILTTVIVLVGGVLMLTREWPSSVRLWDNPAQLVAAAVVLGAVVGATRARKRLNAVLLVGATGYSCAVLFVLHGAPDLALTQLLAETTTMVAFVLVLRRLPARFSERPRWVRRTRFLVAAAIGLLMMGVALVAAGARVRPPVSVDFPEEAVGFGGGQNIVNVTLVDIRAWDTIGELAVLIVAATGVASLLFLRSRTGTEPKGTWAAAARIEAVRADLAARRSVVLEVITRIIFHTMLVFSVYLLFVGHNLPGGGFAAGLVAGLALALRYLAGGAPELDAAAPVNAGKVLGLGMVVACASACVGVLAGGEILESFILLIDIPLVGEVKLVTSLLFDIGVYLVVVGLMLDILRSLGSEIDRQGNDDRPATTADEEPSRGISA